MSHIPPDAHTILRDYAAGPHYTSDLMIGTANCVERVLEQSGVHFSGKGYRAGIMTRQYSRDTVRHFPDSNVRYLRDPDIFREQVVNKGATVPGIFRLIYADELRPLGDGNIQKITNTRIRDLHRAKIADLVGEDSAHVGQGTVHRLLDKPDICDLLIQYFNEHRVAEFGKVLSQSEFYRAGKHRLRETKNQAKHKKPATLGSYIARTFCPEETPSVENKGRTLPEKRQRVLDERDRLLKQVPIDPDKISDESLTKVGLAPADFSHYTLQARRRYKMAASGQFLSLLTQAQMVHRPHGTRRREQQVPTTARIISFIGADREEKIGIFSTVTESHTQEVKSGDTTRNKYRKISDTELRIFAGREEARRSQEHAIEKMRETEVIYTELLTGLSEYGKKEKTEKESYLTSVVDDAIKKLRQKRSYHVELIRRYLTGSQEGKPTLSVVQNPRLIGTLQGQLRRGISDLQGKIGEIESIKSMI